MRLNSLAGILWVSITAVSLCVVRNDVEGTVPESVAPSNVSSTASDYNFTDSSGMLSDSTSSIDAAVRNLSSTLCQSARLCEQTMAAHQPGILEKRCSCDDYCAIFGDCCEDKISSSATRVKALPRESYICASGLAIPYSVYMVVSCPASYANLEISLLCSNSTVLVEPKPDLLSTPVTEIITGTTYKNIYCASCWDQPRNQLAAWSWRYTCPVTAPNSAYEALLLPNQTTVGSASLRWTTPTESHLNKTAQEFLSTACSLTYDPPPSPARVQHCTADVIGDCQAAASTDAARACSSGPTARVYTDGGKCYRNVDCAACNGWPEASTLVCQFPSFAGIPPPVSLSFSVVLSPESGTCTGTYGNRQSSGGWTSSELCQNIKVCPEGSPGAPGCLGACLKGSGKGDGICESINSTSRCIFLEQPGLPLRSEVWNSTFLNDTLMLTLNDKTVLCFICVVERYRNFSVVNGSLVVHVGNEPHRYDYPLYTIEGDVATACSAVSSVPAGGCSVVPDYVSAIALCLSEVGLCLFFVAFSLLRRLRRFPGEMVLNQSVAFFLAFLFFLFRPLGGESLAACTALAVLIHYLLLAAFAWTALYSAEIAQALSFRVSQGVTRSRRVIHYTLAWGLPLVCVVLGITADSLHLDFRPRYGVPQCFISARLGNQTLFIGPLCIFLTIDIFVYAFMIVKLIVIARQTKAVRSAQREKLWLSVKLIFSTGILWIFAVLASFTNSEVLYCIFSLLNALQGVFVFAVFVFKRETLVELRRRMGAPTVTSSGSSTTTQQLSLSSTR